MQNIYAIFDNKCHYNIVFCICLWSEKPFFLKPKQTNKKLKQHPPQKTKTKTTTNKHTNNCKTFPKNVKK